MRGRKPQVSGRRSEGVRMMCRCLLQRFVGGAGAFLVFAGLFYVVARLLQERWRF